jgi:hypothetical protein
VSCSIVVAEGSADDDGTWLPKVRVGAGPSALNADSTILIQFVAPAGISHAPQPSRVCKYTSDMYMYSKHHIGQGAGFEAGISAG